MSTDNVTYCKFYEKQITKKKHLSDRYKDGLVYNRVIGGVFVER